MTDERERALEDARKWLAGGFPGMTCGLVDQLATALIDTSAHVERLTRDYQEVRGANDQKIAEIDHQRREIYRQVTCRERAEALAATQAARIETLEEGGRAFVEYESAVAIGNDVAAMLHYAKAGRLLRAALSHTSKEGVRNGMAEYLEQFDKSPYSDPTTTGAGEKGE
jgi:hypothetical protein